MSPPHGTIRETCCSRHLGPIRGLREGVSREARWFKRERSRIRSLIPVPYSGLCVTYAYMPSRTPPCELSRGVVLRHQKAPYVTSVVSYKTPFGTSSRAFKPHSPRRCLGRMLQGIGGGRNSRCKE